MYWLLVYVYARGLRVLRTAESLFVALVNWNDPVA